MTSRQTLALFLTTIAPISAVAEAQELLSAKQILESVNPASVQILSGEGMGRLRTIGTGVVISSDGVILTALHVVKGAAEVQVRFSNGDAFDRIEMLGSDERRDIAALKITARGLPFLESGSALSMSPGEAIYAVTSANGLGWSAVSGMVSAIRPPDEVPNSGSGFRLVQFNAAVAPGASGGALVNGNGKLVGIITRATSNGVGFAIPVENVLGLKEAEHPVAFGSGALLKTPSQEAAVAPASSEAVAAADPKQLMRQAKTIFLMSKTSFLTIDTLQRSLLGNKDWASLSLTIVGDKRLGDLIVEVDRPLFTYVHTFVLSDKRTTIVLGSGKQTAFDGTTASGGLAKDIIAILAKVRVAAPASTK